MQPSFKFLLITIVLALLPNTSFAEKPVWEEVPTPEGRGHAIWVERERGTLFMSNGKGVRYTRDQGKTWEAAPGIVEKGRHYYSNSFAVESESGALALFSIDAAHIWLSPDQGKSWQLIPKPQGIKHDSWTYGAVDWTEKVPQTLFAKEHHSLRYWLTTDGGKNWSMVLEDDRYNAVGIAPDGSLLICRPPAKDPADTDEKDYGIFRSTDQGKSWQPVFQELPVSKIIPQRFGNTLYWPMAEGLAKSEDSGKSWLFIKGSPKGGTMGPFFGKTEKEMMLVNPEGISVTRDAGENWETLLSREQMPPSIRDADFGERKPCFAWDPEGGILYGISQGVPLQMLKLEK